MQFCCPDTAPSDIVRCDDTFALHSAHPINCLVVGYKDKLQELAVSLSTLSTDTAYSVGRLFAVMEALQQKANGTATIRSRYFASASANPKLVFPTLLSLAQHHIVKAETGKHYDKRMERILSVIEWFPTSLDLEEQGKFILGYYHEREYLYMKKEGKEKLEANYGN